MTGARPRGVCGLKHVPLHPATPRLTDHIPVFPAATQLVPRGFYHSVAEWPMALNDRLGTCPIAGVQHTLQLWGAVAGAERIMTDDAVLEIYRDVGGYDPANPATDRGLVMADLLAAWHQKGLELGDGGPAHQLDAYAAVNPQNANQMAGVIDLVGCCYAGFALPRSALTQTVLDVPDGGAVGDGAPGSEGGHMMLIVGHGPLWPVVTWGSVRMATWDFIRTYCFQAVALFSRSWLTARGTTISGATLDQLEVATAAIAGPAVTAASA